MDNNSLLLVVYRVASLATGLAVVWMGYQLFKIGVYEKAGDLKAAWGPNRFQLIGGAPGSFFALFGAAIISLSLWKGVTLREQASLGLSSQDTEAVRDDSAFTVDPLTLEVGPDQFEALNKLLEGEQLTTDERARMQELLIQLTREWIAEDPEAIDDSLNNT